MKVFVILVCASLSSCALYGVYGPERQKIAQERLRKAVDNFAQAAGNGFGTFAQAYAQGGGGFSSGISQQQQLDRIQQDNDWNQMLLRQQLQTDAMIQRGQELSEQNHAQWQRQMEQNQAQWDQFLHQLTPLP
jgi:hypothetical protein